MADENTSLTRIESFLSGNPDGLQPLTRIEELLSSSGGNIEIDDGTLIMEAADYHHGLEYHYAHVGNLYLISFGIYRTAGSTLYKQSSALFKIKNKHIGTEYTPSFWVLQGTSNLKFTLENFGTDGLRAIYDHNVASSSNVDRLNIGSVILYLEDFR